MRLQRNCSNLEDFKRQALDLRARFLKRGYPNRCLKRAYQRALDTDGSTLLQDRKAEPSRFSQQIRCISTFSDQWENVKRILSNSWNILKADRDLTSVLPHRPTMIARRAESLSDILVHSHFTESKPVRTHFLSPTVGSYKCFKCEACKYMAPTKEFMNSDSTRTYKIKQFINCRTSGVIYVGICSCPKLYVGKTFRELRKRVLEHIGTITRNVDTPLARHIRDFHRSNTQAIKFFGIEKVQLGTRKGDIDKVLLRKECQWIYRLRTKSPAGLNEGFSYLPFISND